MKTNLQDWKILKQVTEEEDQLPKERILDQSDQERYVAVYQWDRGLITDIHNTKYENEHTELEDLGTGGLGGGSTAKGQDSRFN